MWPGHGESRILFLVLLLSWGCGAERECRHPDGELGSCCNSDADCSGQLQCLQQFPGGMCSLTCEEAGSCPPAAACIRVESQSQGSLGRVCLPRCGDGYPSCPEGLSCTTTSVAGLEVCFP